ncbi:MAG TPA: ABC transporter ATP-binding protein, partial [Lachnospiraceae bacterium]|nr:ABC transporter ATP-binding protein [Lachnospiraceae bacterium]
ADPSLHPAQLSGGQKKRAALVAAVLTPSDLLILDEPTNHLDEDMILWLQDFLQNYRGALLMVTHDRYFLDEVTGEILEIDKGSAYRYDAGYSGYLELRQQRFDYALAAERKMAALYKKDLAWMQRGARARSTKQKAHIQRFEALRDRDKIVQDRQVEINSLPSRIGGKTIEAHAVSGGYGGRVLFHDFTYMFTKTDRVGIIGPNGCGKTTLLKTLLGIIPPASGSVEIGQTIRIGYFSQENEALDEDKRVIDYIRDTAEYIRTADGLVSASAMCERFLFSPEMQYARISKLSGGEKRRLYLLRVLMEAPNVLVLDEPTNDLDITTLQVLEDYLDRFAGIIITVSHDRYFLDRVVTRLFAFEKDGTLFKSEGGYSEYREHREALRGREDSLWSSAPSGPSGSREASGADGKGRLQGDASGNAPARRGKLSYKDQREYDTIEEEIDRLQAQSDDLAAQIQENATDFEKLAELSAKKDETDAEIDRKMERYLELQDMVDALRGDVR